MKIVALDVFTMGREDVSWDDFSQLGEFTKYDRTPPELILERAGNAEAILINKVAIGEKELAQLPNLKYIGVLATGYNVVDLDVARKYGVAVTNVPQYGTNSVAQMTFCHILNLTNHLYEHTQSVKNGDWSSCPDFCYRLFPQVSLVNKTLGIVGYGRIGQAVAKIGRALGMNIKTYSLPLAHDDSEVEFVSLDELFAQSDIISLHCPATKENEKFINSSLLKKMKPSAFLVNTSRGNLINEEDLAEALQTECLAGAGLDVLSSEPPEKTNVLLKTKNCFITPHLAWSSVEARNNLMNTALENLKAFTQKQLSNRVD